MASIPNAAWCPSCASVTRVGMKPRWTTVTRTSTLRGTSGRVMGTVETPDDVLVHDAACLKCGNRFPDLDAENREAYSRRRRRFWASQLLSLPPVFLSYAAFPAMFHFLMPAAVLKYPWWNMLCPAAIGGTIFSALASVIVSWIVVGDDRSVLKYRGSFGLTLLAFVTTWLVAVRAVHVFAMAMATIGSSQSVTTNVTFATDCVMRSSANPSAAKVMDRGTIRTTFMTTKLQTAWWGPTQSMRVVVVVVALLSPCMLLSAIGRYFGHSARCRFSCCKGGHLGAIARLFCFRRRR